MAVRGSRGGTVAVEGLAEFVRDCRRIGGELPGEVRKELRGVAGIVEGEAREVAIRKGLVKTGRLVRATKRFAAGARAGVRNFATNRGYRYPERFEYGDGGVRAFLEPALDNKQDDVVDALDDMLGRLADRRGF